MSREEREKGGTSWGTAIDWLAVPEAGSARRKTLGQPRRGAAKAPGFRGKANPALM